MSPKLYYSKRIIRLFRLMLSSMFILLLWHDSKSQTPFTCDGTGYLASAPTSSSQSTIYYVDANTGSLSGGTLALQTHPYNINAIGYNIVDNLIYGINDRLVGTGALGSQSIWPISIDATGSVTSLGKPTSSESTANQSIPTWEVFTNPGYGISPNAGTVGINKYYIFGVDKRVSPTQAVIVILDLTTMTYIDRVVSLNKRSNDITFNPKDGLLYGLGGGKVLVTNPNTGNQVELTPTGSDITGVEVGGNWANLLGDIFFYDNGNGNFYKYSTEANSIELVNPVSTYPIFDATACFPSSLEKELTTAGPYLPGDIVHYKFAVVNGSSSPLVGNFGDILNPNLQWIPGSIFPSNPGGGTVNFSGQSLTINNMTVPTLTTSGGAPLEFIVQVKILDSPALYGQCLSNTATFTSGSLVIQSDDPNNSTSNTDATQFCIEEDPNCNDPLRYADECDFDRDGIPNGIDLDDDNDGILDVDECPDSEVVFDQILTGSQPYTINAGSVNVTVTHDNTNMSVNNLTGLPGFNVVGNTYRTAYYNFSETVEGLTFNVYDIDTEEYVRIVAKDINGAVIPLQDSWFTLGSAIFKINTGEYRGTAYTANFELAANQSITVDFPVAVKSLEISFREAAAASSSRNFATSAFGFTQPICDYDNDGKPNQFDLDSDGDGCFDSLEGGDAVSTTQLDANGMIAGAVDADGIPIDFSPNGQTVNTSQNASTQDPDCNQCNAGSQGPTLTSFSGSNTCPQEFVNLSDYIASACATGIATVWSTSGTSPSGNHVSNPYTVGTGSYYVYCYDSVNDCYSPPSGPLAITINPCADCNSTAAEICNVIAANPDGSSIENLDCDGDGLTNKEECSNGTDPKNPCDPATATGERDNLGNYVTTSAWYLADCDGDGVRNGQEVDPDGNGTPGGTGSGGEMPTDPQNACDYEVAFQNYSLTSTAFKAADCDGDGVSNGKEIDPDGNGTAGGTGTNGPATDPKDPCDYNNGDITLPVTADQSGCIVCPTITNTPSGNTNPTSCSVDNGSITICGLTASQSGYVLAYERNGSPQSVTITADAGGCYTLTGLGAGSYTNIQVSHPVDCPGGSNVIASITLTQPAAPVIGKGVTVNPTGCGQADGSIQITGLTAGLSYTLTYEKNGSAQTPITFTAGGSTYTLQNLTSGSYTDIMVSLEGCVSNTLSHSLSDPVTATINITGSSNPTLCSGNNGSFAVSGLAPGSYTLYYMKNGLDQTPVSFTTAGTSYTLQGLTAGSYSNIRVESSGCSSNSVSVALSDPGAPIISLGTPNQPSACGLSDGSFTVSGLTPGVQYTLKYRKDGISQSDIVFTATGSSYTLSGLDAAIYSSITVSQSYCRSNALTQVLKDPGGATISAVVTASPSVCGANDGSITISGLTSGLSYTLNYVYNGTQQSPLNFTATGTTYLMNNLVGGSYTGINVTQGGCTSNSINTNLANPGGAAIDYVAVNAQTCVPGNDGKVIVTGLSQGVSYTLSYDKNGVAQSNISIPNSTSTSYSINGLTIGTYSNIRVNQGGCISNILSAEVGGPSPLAAPALSTGTLSNECPAPVADLESITASNNSGYTLTWHTASPANTSNRISDPGNVGAGTYYAAFYNSLTQCYGETTPVVVSIKVCQHPPVATNDVAITPQDTPVSGNVLTNDSDPDGDNLTVNPTPTSQPSNGSVVLNPNGTYTYTPNPGYTGEDTFCYEISDGTSTDEACVTIDVIPNLTEGNDPPVAVNDNTETPLDTPVTINVKSNDSDPDGDALSTPTILTPPGNGTVVVNPNGTVTYTPNSGFTGEDSFVYQICDPLGLCDEATVTVLVKDEPSNPTENDPPVAVDDAETTDLNTPVSSSVAGNDSDPDNTAGELTYTKLSDPGNGTVVFNSDGSYTYTPNTGFTGSDSFIYRVCDPLGACDEATVSLAVLKGEPDLNPAITVVPNNGIKGSREMVVLVDIKEILGNPTDASVPIQIYIPKVSQFSFNWGSYATTTAMPEVAVSGLENSDWTYSESPTSWIWTYNGGNFEGNEISNIGFKGIWDAGATSGQINFSITILNGSGKETNTLNNTDFEKITFDVNTP